MNIESYLESVGREVGALKQRVRHLIAKAHWQTDGEWKESVLRQVLRRHLPETAIVSRGFVLSGTKVSSQIDILIHDSSKPVIFKDGDLVFVTPDAVLGLIEVKSRVNPTQFGKAANKLGKNIELVRLHPNTRAFAALFSYESADGALDACLDHARSSAPRRKQRLDFAAIGSSGFIKYWDLAPDDSRRLYESWHSYNLAELAAGYFVHNVVDSVSPESVFSNSDVWFPARGKEPNRVGIRTGIWRVGPE